MKLSTLEKRIAEMDKLIKECMEAGKSMVFSGAPKKEIDAIYHILVKAEEKSAKWRHKYNQEMFNKLTNGGVK